MPQNLEDDVTDDVLTVSSEDVDQKSKEQLMILILMLLMKTKHNA